MRFSFQAIWSRFFPASAFIRDTLAAGTIGEPKYMSAVFAADVNTDEWDDPYYGCHYFMGVYPLQVALSLFDGEPNDVVTSTVKNKHGKYYIYRTSLCNEIGDPVKRNVVIY
jgi:predicted dehydrogenase